ncbi:hypothetical protein QN277_001812 [Acacia crassicarpa]|uniref:F-box domain-containing protein n=1 Tax=Acacia crassicarpa TaxID=499986 RepID=A0AAE1N7V3_9FABA|nr:hypothetical protein QN277_001812 [Acacia crassicarpa]
MVDSGAPKRIKLNTYDGEICRLITCLPTEILEEIASKVASQSLADLYHLKLTCKEMMSITDKDYVYKHASLDRVPFFRSPEIPQEASFLKRCRLSGNLESLYRKGMEAYLMNYELYEEGLGMVRMAAQNQHKRSMYAFAMVVLLMWRSGRIGNLWTEEFGEALGYLRFLRNHKCVLECRNQVAEFVRRGNMCCFVAQAPIKSLCCNIPCKNTWRLKIGSWFFETEDDDENDPNMCENCRWDHEVEEFCANVLNISVSDLPYLRHP